MKLSARDPNPISSAIREGELPHRAGRLRLFMPVLLLALFAVQSLWFVGTQSLTVDEPAHLIAGTEAWQQGRFQSWNDHPPLGRLWLTLPLARTHIEFTRGPFPSEYELTGIKPGPEWIAWHTRPMNTLLGLTLGVTLWFAARRLFSEGAANVALALYAFTPSLIAHFSVMTTDGIGTLFVFLTAFQLVRWRMDPDFRQTTLMGLVLGGLLLSKFYALPLVALALGMMLVVGPEHKPFCGRRWRWKPVLAALVIALITLWAGYFFHTSHLKIGEGRVSATYPNRDLKIWTTKSTVHVNTLVPAGEFFEGLREVAFTNRRGRPAWFLGHIYPKGGVKLYYPVAIVLKWPTVLLVLFLASLALGVRRTCRAPDDLLLILLFPLLFFGFALQSRYNIGERHILPLYPFALLVAGGIWEHVRNSRRGSAVVVLALLLNAADALRAAPDYLSYFNIFVSPSKSWRLLTDSNLDWGQGLIALRNYEQQHPDEQIHLAYFGSVDPVIYGVRATPLAPEERPSGTVVVAATDLSGQVLEDPNAYRWLVRIQPTQLIDRSMLVFHTQGK